jgi:hypothetical protein
MQIVIEKNVPMPKLDDARGRGKSPLRLAMEVMEVGDSLISPKSKIQTQAIISGFRKRGDRSFATRAIDGQVRVWRTK